MKQVSLEPRVEKTKYDAHPEHEILHYTPCVATYGGASGTFYNSVLSSNP